jgi:TolB-like protein
MSAYAARGDRGLALEAFEHCAAALAERSGAAPSPETAALAETIRNAAARVAPIAPAPPAPPPPVPPMSSVPPQRSGERTIRLGVMPFRSLDRAEQDQLAMGLAEEITTALASFRIVTLLSSSSLNRLANEPRDNADAWQRFDLDFLVDGTIQRSGERVRVMVRLLDMRSNGEVAWARRFDRTTTDVLAMQDDIAAEVAAQIDPELLLREARRSLRPAVDATAHALLLQAIPSIYQLDRSRFVAAGEALGSVVALAPEYAAAHAWWAYWHLFLHGQGWADDPRNAVTRAEALAARALSLDPTDARAMTIAGHVCGFLHHRIAEAAALHERALALNPNLPIAWVFSGLTSAYLGEHEDAIERVERAKRLSPFDPHSYFFDTAAMVPKLLRGEFAEVIELGRRVESVNPSITSSHKLHLAALGHLARDGEAARVRAQLLALEPDFSVEAALARAPMERPADRETYRAGLLRAGLRETC